MKKAKKKAVKKGKRNYDNKQRNRDLRKKNPKIRRIKKGKPETFWPETELAGKTAENLPATSVDNPPVAESVTIDNPPMAESVQVENPPVAESVPVENPPVAESVSVENSNQAVEITATPVEKDGTTV